MVMIISLRILSQAWGTTLKMNIQKKKKEYSRAKIFKTSHSQKTVEIYL